MSLSDGLDRIHLILTWLLGEFISIQRFVVFVVGMVMAYLLTCSKHTAQARPLLMMIIVVESLVIERSIISWYVNGENNTNNMVSNYSCDCIIITSHRNNYTSCYGSFVTLQCLFAVSFWCISLCPIVITKPSINSYCKRSLNKIVRLKDTST